MKALLLIIIALLIVSGVIGHPILGCVFVVAVIALFIGINYRDVDSRNHTSEEIQQPQTKNDTTTTIKSRIAPCATSVLPMALECFSPGSWKASTQKHNICVAEHQSTNTGAQMGL